MTKFIDTTNNKSVKESKKTELTHFLHTDYGWTKETNTDISKFEVIKYLGNCKLDGDMFAAYQDGYIVIYKGIKGNEFLK